MSVTENDTFSQAARMVITLTLVYTRSDGHAGGWAGSSHSHWREQHQPHEYTYCIRACHWRQQRRRWPRAAAAAYSDSSVAAGVHPQNTDCPPWWRATGRRAQPVPATGLPAALRGSAAKCPAAKINARARHAGGGRGFFLIAGNDSTTAIYKSAV